MVSTFKIIRTPRIVFGAGEIKKLPELIISRGKVLLIITGARSYSQNKFMGNTFALLEKNGFILHFDRIEHEPSPGDIDRITERFRSLDINTVISIGGGSVIDAGKAVSALLPLEASVRDYLEGVGTKTHPGLKVHFVAIPTTSGTGSEATANAVISETGIHGFKKSIRHENLVPDIALVDPELTLSCPPEITAAVGMDAFTQLMESYLSLKSNPFTDAIAFDGIQKIHQYLLRAYNQGNDIEARSGMAYAALLSGITLANAGLGLIHGFASSVGGLFNIPHGTLCGTLMGAINRRNIEMLLKEDDSNNIAIEKYCYLGKLFSGRNDKDKIWYTNYFADYLDYLIETLKIDHLLKYGITQNDLEKITLATDHKANPVKFSIPELVKILESRL